MKNIYNFTVSSIYLEITKITRITLKSHMKLEKA